MPALQIRFQNGLDGEGFGIPPVTWGMIEDTGRVVIVSALLASICEVVLASYQAQEGFVTNGMRLDAH